MTSTTVGAKGQVTIPATLRKKYGFYPGTRVIWIDRGDGVALRPVLSLKELRGHLRPRPGQISLTSALLDERRLERKKR